ncbi:MAG TPA: hypothetical protein VM219_08980 [Phycisphaerae bacterium]|nr:hypothetical protein [Phycisphaerae bacterium]HUX02999.1 hypothetical protein [Phycisphaerae bacterium]
MSAKSKVKRPRGAKTKILPVVEVSRSRCPKCESTERTRVLGRPPREWAYNGVDPGGKPFTHVVWRHCVCVACGQRFVEKTYENRVATPRGTRKKV